MSEWWPTFWRVTPTFLKQLVTVEIGNWLKRKRVKRHQRLRTFYAYKHPHLTTYNRKPARKTISCPWHKKDARFASASPSGSDTSNIFAFIARTISSLSLARLKLYNMGRRVVYLSWTLWPKIISIKILKMTYKTDGQLGGRSGVPPART